jgi:hypothetical protein
MKAKESQGSGYKEKAAAASKELDRATFGCKPGSLQSFAREWLRRVI